MSSPPDPRPRMRKAPRANVGRLSLIELQAPSTYRKPCEAQQRFTERACRTQILRALVRIEARVLRLVCPDGRADNLNLSREYWGGGQ